MLIWGENDPIRRKQLPVNPCDLVSGFKYSVLRPMSLHSPTFPGIRLRIVGLAIGRPYAQIKPPCPSLSDTSSDETITQPHRLSRKTEPVLSQFSAERVSLTLPIKGLFVFQTTLATTNPRNAYSYVHIINLSTARSWGSSN
jgi:hypothetical protein